MEIESLEIFPHKFFILFDTFLRQIRELIYKLFLVGGFALLLQLALLFVFLHFYSKITVEMVFFVLYLKKYRVRTY